MYIDFWCFKERSNCCLLLFRLTWQLWEIYERSKSLFRLTWPLWNLFKIFLLSIFYKEFFFVLNDFFVTVCFALVTPPSHFASASLDSLCPTSTGAEGETPWHALGLLSIIRFWGNYWTSSIPDCYQGVALHLFGG